MNLGETREVDADEIVADLISAGYVEVIDGINTPTQTKKETSSKNTTPKKAKKGVSKDEGK